MNSRISTPVRIALLGTALLAAPLSGVGVAQDTAPSGRTTYSAPRVEEHEDGFDWGLLGLLGLLGLAGLRPRRETVQTVHTDHTRAPARTM
jgi:MYXO-CTERM domain-containing protein